MTSAELQVITHLRDAAEGLWGVVANAFGGNWDLASPEWRAAAERTRDDYVVAEAAARDLGVVRRDDLVDVQETTGVSERITVGELCDRYQRLLLANTKAHEPVVRVTIPPTPCEHCRGSGRCSVGEDCFVCDGLGVTYPIQTGAAR